MTPAALDAIEARVTAATTGPWRVGPFESCAACTGDWPIYDIPQREHGFKHQADAEFIAHARQDVPALLAEVRRLQGLVKQAEVSALFDGDLVCPWCLGCHEPTCPAFSAPGVLR